jgi:type III secretory pathway component EscU
MASPKNMASTRSVSEVLPIPIIDIICCSLHHQNQLSFPFFPLSGLCSLFFVAAAVLLWLPFFLLSVVAFFFYFFGYLLISQKLIKSRLLSKKRSTELDEYITTLLFAA